MKRIIAKIKNYQGEKATCPLTARVVAGPNKGQVYVI